MIETEPLRVPMEVGVKVYDDVQGCTFWINGEQVGWAKYGKRICLAEN